MLDFSQEVTIVFVQKYIPGKLSTFFSRYKTITYKKGETILRSDDKPQGVYYVKTGFVKLNTIFENGREHTLNIFKAGTYFPMMWAIGRIPNSYFFHAQTEVIIYRAPKASVLRFLKKNPDVLFELTRRILIGLDGILQNIEFILCGDSYHRVLGALFLSAKRFGEQKKEGEITIKIPLTHQDIANIAGISRETATLAIKRLRKKKIIIYKKRFIVIVSIKTIEKELSLDKKEGRVPIVA